MEFIANFREKGIRDVIQETLSQIEDIDCGVPIPDGMVENGTTYFGYELMLNYVPQYSDLDKNYTMEINLTGRIVRRKTSNENTLSIVDTALSNIKEKLKELNFKYSYNDINTDNNFKKILVKAYVRYNEINNELIV